MSTAYRADIALFAASFIWASLAGCSSAQRYRAPSPELGGEVVATRVRLDESTLQTETDAGYLRVVGVTLEARGGERIDPDRVRARPDRWVGGSSVGMGVGFGSGYVGSSSGARLGVGSARTLGGTVAPGALIAEWDDAPVDLQPWTLLVQVQPRSNDQATVETRVLLATVLDATSVEGQPGVTIERLRLPGGEAQTWRVERAGDETRWLRVAPVGSEPPR